MNSKYLAQLLFHWHEALNLCQWFSAKTWSFFFFFLIKRKKKKKMAIVECFIQVVEKLRQNPFNNKKSLEEDSSSQHIVKTIFYFICMKQKWKSSRWHLRMTKNWISSCLFLFFFFFLFYLRFFFSKRFQFQFQKEECNIKRDI